MKLASSALRLLYCWHDDVEDFREVLVVVPGFERASCAVRVLTTVVSRRPANMAGFFVLVLFDTQSITDSWP